MKYWRFPASAILLANNDMLGRNDAEPAVTGLSFTVLQYCRTTTEPRCLLLTRGRKQDEVIVLVDIAHRLLKHNEVSALSNNTSSHNTVRTYNIK